MATRTLRLKVAVPDLIAKIEARKTELEAEYQKSLAQYPKQIATWNKKALVALDDAVRLITDDPESEVVFRDSSYHRGRYTAFLKVTSPRLAEKPTKPTKPNTGQMDRDLRLLKATSEEVITVSADDNLASYL